MLSFCFLLLQAGPGGLQKRRTIGSKIRTELWQGSSKKVQCVVFCPCSGPGTEHAHTLAKVLQLYSQSCEQWSVTVFCGFYGSLDCLTAILGIQNCSSGSLCKLSNWGVCARNFCNLSGIPCTNSPRSRYTSCQRHIYKRPSKPGSTAARSP